MAILDLYSATFLKKSGSTIWGCEGSVKQCYKHLIYLI